MQENILTTSTGPVASEYIASSIGYLSRTVQYANSKIPTLLLQVLVPAYIPLIEAVRQIISVIGQLVEAY